MSVEKFSRYIFLSTWTICYKFAAGVLSWPLCGWRGRQSWTRRLLAASEMELALDPLKMFFAALGRDQTGGSIFRLGDCRRVSAFP